MAIARTNLHVSRVVTTADVSISATTAAFTPVASALLVVAVGALNGPASSLIPGLTSISGGGLTWTKRAQIGQLSSSGYNYTGTCEIWTAPVGSSPASMTVTAAGGLSDTDPAQVTFEIFSLADVDTTTPTGATATGNPATLGSTTITLGAAPASTSLVVGARFACPRYADDLTAVQGTGWTEIYESPSGSAGYGDLETQERTGSTSTSVTWDQYVVEAVDMTVSAAIAVEFIETSTPTGNSGSGTAAFSALSVAGAAARTNRGILRIGAGTTIYSAAAGTSVAPTYPASLAANDLLLLFIGMKPSTANSGTVTQPTGWTLVTSLVGAGGYGTTLATDTGNTNIYVYKKDTVSGSESGALTVTVGTNNVCWGSIQAFRCGSKQWSVAAATGSDTVAGNVSCTFGSDPGVTQYDAAFVAMCIPTDVTTPSQFSAEEITQTGVTYKTAVEISEPDSTNGNDIGGLLCWAEVASGTSSAAPVFAATVGGTNTNVRGPLAFIRIRELGVDGLASGKFSSIAVSGSGSVGSAGNSGSGSAAFKSFTVTGSGAIAITSSGSAALKSLATAGTGSESFTGSGTAAAKSLAASGSGAETFTGSGSVGCSPVAAAGSGSQVAAGVSGTGSAAFKPFTTAGSGSEAFTSSGSSAFKSFAASGSGAETFTGSGSTALRQLTVAGSGNQAAGISGSGSAKFVSFACSGTGTETYSGTGSAAFNRLAAAGTGTETYSGTGSAAFRPLASSGSGAETFAGTGSMALRSLALAGSGAETFTGSGSAAFNKLAFAGSGNQTVGVVGSGTAAFRSIACSGSGSEAFSGSGSAALKQPNPAGSGTSLLSVSGSGSLAVRSLAVAGTGLERFTGSGSAAFNRLAAAGTAALTFIGSGSAALSRLGLSGSGGIAYFGSGTIELTGFGASGSGGIIAPPVSGSGGMQLASFAVLGSSFVGVVGPGKIKREHPGYGDILRVGRPYGTNSRSIVEYGTIERAKAI